MAPDFSSKVAVIKAAIALRKKHGALEWSASVDQLIERHGLSQGRWSPTRDKWSLARAIAEVGKKVKALISLKESVILVADDLHQAREAFAKGHELGHGTLEWHREILYVCDEHDLSAKARAQMEWEANAFSGEILFPTPLMEKVYAQYPTSMETVLQLRSWTGASIESCAFAYVERHPGKCVLLTLDSAKNTAGRPELLVKGKCVSKAASKSRLGSLQREQKFSAEHVLYTNSRGDGVAETQLHFADEPLKHYKVSVLNNQYRVIALIFDP